VKAENAPAHATSQIYTVETTGLILHYTVFYTSWLTELASFGRMKFFQACRCFLHDEKASFTPLFFFFAGVLSQKSFIKRHYTFSLLSSGRSSSLTRQRFL